MSNVPHKSVYQQGQTPNMLGEAYLPIGKTDFQFKDFLNDHSKVEEVKYLNYFIKIVFKFLELKSYINAFWIFFRIIILLIFNLKCVIYTIEFIYSSNF